MAYRVTSQPDTIQIVEPVREWMANHWKDQLCQACLANSWKAEPRAFGALRLPFQSGLMRDMFLVVCEECGNTLFINSQIAGVRPSAVPNDLSGLDSEGNIQDP